MFRQLRSIKSSVICWFVNRRMEKSREEAKTVPDGWLFQADGWGPGRAPTPPKPYRGPLYPAPSYEIYASAKKRPAFTEQSMVHCNQGRRMWAAGKVAEASACYAKAIESCPSNPEFAFEQAQLLWSQDKLIEAKKLLEGALAVSPNFVSARVSLYRICLQLGDQRTPCRDFLNFLKTRDETTTTALRFVLSDDILKGPRVQ